MNGWMDGKWNGISVFDIIMISWWIGYLIDYTGVFTGFRITHMEGI